MLSGDSKNIYRIEEKLIDKSRYIRNNKREDTRWWRASFPVSVATRELMWVVIAVIARYPVGSGSLASLFFMLKQPRGQRNDRKDHCWIELYGDSEEVYLHHASPPPNRDTPEPNTPDGRRFDDDYPDRQVRTCPFPL